MVKHYKLVTVLCIVLPVYTILYLGDARSKESVSLNRNKGFILSFDDPESEVFFSLRIRTAMEFRYTYAVTDGETLPYNLAGTGYRQGNREDYSAFDMRRLRLYLDGKGPTSAWRYYIHVQLEPNSGVNAHDGYVEWKALPGLRLRFGRMKIPAFGMEFWQSGFKLNGTDRTLFTGDSENDKDLFGTRTYDFPSGNARLRVGGHTLSNGFATGGMTLYRSQGMSAFGESDAFGQKQMFHYALGVFNGRDSRGFNPAGRSVLVTGRFGINLLAGSDPAGPLSSAGLAGYTMQGDIGTNDSPLLAVLFSGFWGRSDVPDYFEPDPDAEGFVKVRPSEHEMRNYGFSASLLFRFLGFSADLEAAWEEFEQGGNRAAVWDRWGGRLNLGHFLVPGEIEATAKLAYLVRLDASNLRNSIESGLGLVKRRSGWMVEKGLMETRVGVNWYLHGYSQMAAFDVAWLRTRLGGISGDEVLQVLGTDEATGEFAGEGDVENDFRFRLMYQYIF